MSRPRRTVPGPGLRRRDGGHRDPARQRQDGGHPAGDAASIRAATPRAAITASRLPAQRYRPADRHPSAATTASAPAAGVVHMLLDDEAVAGCRAALERAGMGIADAREVFVIDVEDRPAALGELTRRLAEANVNVDLAYTTFTGGKIVIATDDAGSARSVLRA